jgi:hypothetical protein
MIARIWRGVVRTEDADGYAGYIRETGGSSSSATSRCATTKSRTQDNTPKIISSERLRPGPARSAGVASQKALGRPQRRSG